MAPPPPSLVASLVPSTLLRATLSQPTPTGPFSAARQAEHGGRDDVALDLVAATVDRARARLVERPAPVELVPAARDMLPGQRPRLAGGLDDQIGDRGEGVGRPDLQHR